MYREKPQSAYLSLRIPRKLDAALKQAAERESNTTSAVVRRLIALGLAREQPAAEQNVDASNNRTTTHG